MRRITLPVTMAICSCSLVIAAYAAKTTTSTTTAAPATTEAEAAPEAEATGGKKHHTYTPSMRSVLSLPSLDDQQKGKIQAIYEKNRPQFNGLKKQMKELQESEWESVKPLLKPEQIASLSSGQHRAPAGQAKPQGAPLDKGEVK